MTASWALRCGPYDPADQPRSGRSLTRSRSTLARGAPVPLPARYPPAEETLHSRIDVRQFRSFRLAATCTYRPQKPFRLFFAFTVYPSRATEASRLCLPCCHQQQGRFPATATRLHRYYQPLRHPLACQPISRCSRYYEEGFSGLARPRHRAVATTPPEWSQFAYAMLPSSFGADCLPSGPNALRP